jgi:hypothetical protein
MCKFIKDRLAHQILYAIVWSQMPIPGYIARFLGANPDSFARVRLGRGVVGNTTYGLWATGATLIGVSFALRNSPAMALIADAGIIFVYLSYLIGTYIFAHNHPDMAMLGDTEWLKWHEHQSTARDKSIVLDQTPVVGTNPTLIENSSGGGDA